jgi:hypothetical protein
MKKHAYNIGDEVEFYPDGLHLCQGIIRGKYEFNQYLIQMNKKELYIHLDDIKGLVGDLTKTTEYYNDR